MDWERICRAYVAYIQIIEGTTFLTHNAELEHLVELSEEETAALIALGEEAEQEREAQLRSWWR